MIYTIKIGEHCFGPYLKINDQSVIDYGYDDSTLNVELVKFIFGEINSIKDKLTSDNLISMMSIISGRTNNLHFRLTEDEYESLVDDDYDALFLCKKFNYDKDIIIGELVSIQDELDSMDWNKLMKIIIEAKEIKRTKYKTDSCDQCGNWNHDETYEIEL